MKELISEIVRQVRGEGEKLTEITAIAIRVDRAREKSDVYSKTLQLNTKIFILLTAHLCPLCLPPTSATSSAMLTFKRRMIRIERYESTISLLESPTRVTSRVAKVEQIVDNTFKLIFLSRVQSAQGERGISRLSAS